MSDLFAKALQHFKSGDLELAMQFAQAAAAEPAATQPVFMLLANLHLKKRNRREAAAAFVRTAGFGGDNIGFLLKNAVTLFQGVGATDEVANIGNAALQANPGDPDLVFIVVEAFLHTGRLADVIANLDRLDRLDPRHFILLVNYHRLTGTTAAIYGEICARSDANPDDASLKFVQYSLARELCDIEAIRQFEAIMADPDTPEASALLSREHALARRFWCDNEAVLARPDADSIILSQQREALGRLARREISPEGQPLKIGYISNDFRTHPTMVLFDDILLQHDRERFDVTIFCYTEKAAADIYQSKWPDHIRAKVVRIAGLSDKQAAALVAEHEIDILVDLKGHTLLSRLGIVNLADAPVKATWFGFPGSVHGVDLDYTITDPVVTPDSSRASFEEKLARLPETYQPNRSLNRALPVRPDRQSAGLPDNKIVFASFNAIYKITPQAVSAWTRILRAVPDSVLWILCPAPTAQKNLLRAFADAGIEGERVIFARQAQHGKHIDRLALADLALDTFPYNGHTTTSDLLWAGVPLVGWKGQSFASRVSASLLSANGLEGLIADGEEEFCRLAIDLARNPDRLAAYRRQIEEGRFTKPLFDSARFTRHLELAYEEMAARARRGEAPDHFDVAPLPARERPFDL
jgi:predicted O-linked N-acetylglucosamine transferase (SPINDLY family)